MLAMLSVLLIVNRKTKIPGFRYVWAMIGIVLCLTLCEALEDICDIYHMDYRILYFKTAMVYWLYPLTAMLELYLVAPIKQKLILAMPYIISSGLVAVDLFDTRMIYYFKPDHSYNGGLLSALPVAVLCFYVIMLGLNSTLMLGSGYHSQGVIAMFMALTSVLTAFGETMGFAEGFTEEVTALEMLIYYFFLTAICYSETQQNLSQSRLELEQQRLRLLVVQMQPHFIFNTLAAIQSLCYTDSEAAADCIDIFGDYLRANINSLSSDEPIPFDDEMTHIEQYIRLEKASRDDRFTVVYDLKKRDFSIPPLTVQPIVENAIKHGALSRRDGKGVVKIITAEDEENIYITVTDNGTGASLTEKQKEHHSVGLENVKKRLAIQCGGTLSSNFSEKGSCSVITLPKNYEPQEVDQNVHYRS